MTKTSSLSAEESWEMAPGPFWEKRDPGSGNRPCLNFLMG